MEVSVYYRGALDKLHQIDVAQVTDHAEAIAVVEEELRGDLFAKKPFLAKLEGGKK
jgi:hypothetical protein